MSSYHIIYHRTRRVDSTGQILNLTAIAVSVHSLVPLLRPLWKVIPLWSTLLKWERPRHGLVLLFVHICSYNTIPLLKSPLEVLVAVVLGVLWSENLPPISPKFHFLDLFAGQANASKVWSLGYHFVATVHPEEIRV